MTLDEAIQEFELDCTVKNSVRFDKVVNGIKHHFFLYWLWYHGTLETDGDTTVIDGFHHLIHQSFFSSNHHSARPSP